MTNQLKPVWTLAAKDLADARRTRLLLVLSGFLTLAGLVSLAVAAAAQKADYLAYIEARDLLISLGKPIADLVEPKFFPLKLMRGFIEHIEIIGGIIGIVLGYRAAAVERGNATLQLVLTRPLSHAQFILGKLLGNGIVIAAGLSATFLIASLTLYAIGGIGLGFDSYGRLGITLMAATLYVGIFFMLGLLFALTFRKLPSALLAAFAVWLALVLVAPQIGDTLDPDNQVAGGIFRTLNIAKPQEIEILKTFATYETVRDGIEQASPAKHFERLSFAILGIKDTYLGMPVAQIMQERIHDLWWLLGAFTALAGILLLRPLNPTRLIKEN